MRRSATSVYARLMRNRSVIATGYPAGGLDVWVLRARRWAGDEEPADLPRIQPLAITNAACDVFGHFISAAKDRSPAAAVVLIEPLRAH